MRALGVAAVGEHDARGVLDLLHVAKGGGGISSCSGGGGGGGGVGGGGGGGSGPREGVEPAGAGGGKQEEKDQAAAESLAAMEDWELQTCDSPTPAREEEAGGQRPCRLRRRSLILRLKSCNSSESM